MMRELFSLMVSACLCVLVGCSCVYRDYCVIGAGPGGLQMAYFLHRANRDYIVFERSDKPGSFFETYPRHRTLISINKRHTGQKNAEFNMRHDWNSLLSHDDELKFTKYSTEMFPHADQFLTYIHDYQTKLKLKVQYKTMVSQIQPVDNTTAPDGHIFYLVDQRNQCYHCRTLVSATGIATPNIPNMEGIELAEGYETTSLDPRDYEGKSVLILGRGNAAFEVADGIYGSTSSIHMIARSRVRLAWATHYVGDLRAVNNGLLDTYQLKSLDGLLEHSVTELMLVKNGDQIELTDKDGQMKKFDNQAMRYPYDVVIRALGFKFDPSLFNMSISLGKYRTRKYPDIESNYESVDVKGLFYAGTVSHSLDFRKSAGGFIHGFRYTARALHHLLEWRYEKVRWPSKPIHSSHLLNFIIKRINEASGIYQMFEVLGDIVVFPKEETDNLLFVEEFPLALLHDFPQQTGLPVPGAVMAIVMEYGHNFSGPGKDIFRSGRATGDPSDAHKSNFLHPVLYHYNTLPTLKMMASKDRKETLPKPDAIHHLVEDFNTLWDGPISHILTLRRFLENVMKKDVRKFYSSSCFKLALTFDSLPEHCDRKFLHGRGLSGTEDLRLSALHQGF